MSRIMGGRRRIRDDHEALSQALPTSQVDQIKEKDDSPVLIQLGEVYCAIMLDLIELFCKTSQPIGQADRDAIIARHSKSPGSTILSQLRAKGAIVSDTGDTHHDKDVVPRFDGVIYVNSRTRLVVWPPEKVGTSRGQVLTSLTCENNRDIETPVRLSPRMADAYGCLIDYVENRVPKSSHLTRGAMDVALAGPPFINRIGNLVRDLENIGLLARVSGSAESSKHKSDPLIRRLVIRPYVQNKAEGVNQFSDNEDQTRQAVADQQAQEKPVAPEQLVPPTFVPPPAQNRLRTKEELASELKRVCEEIALKREQAIEERREPIKRKIEANTQLRDRLRKELVEAEAEEQRLQSEFAQNITLTDAEAGVEDSTRRDRADLEFALEHYDRFVARATT